MILAKIRDLVAVVVEHVDVVVEHVDEHRQEDRIRHRALVNELNGIRDALTRISNDRG